MNILALDSSGEACSAAVYRDDLVSEVYLCREKKHSETLMLAVESALAMAGMKKKDIELLAVTNGPGSFTGIRIGLAAAKGMAQALDIPCVAMNTLDVLKENIAQFNGVLCPIIDARRSEVYSAAYRKGELLVPKGVRPMAELLEELQPCSEAVCFVGDGVAVHKELAKEALGEKAYFAPGQLLQQRAGALARLASKAGKETYLDAYTLEADYYRVSQAERVRQEKEDASKAAGA